MHHTIQYIHEVKYQLMSLVPLHILLSSTVYYVQESDFTIHMLIQLQ